MPRFYFHLYSGGDVLIDPEGVELPDLETLRTQAVIVARGLIAADATSGVVDLDTMLRIVDEADTPVFELTFSDAVAFISSGPRSA